MLLRFFTVPLCGGEEAAEELNRFLGAYRIVTIDRQFVQDGPNSVWALCVTYVQASSRALSGKRGKIDYRDVLSEPDFAVFARLRALRKTLADKEGVPAYALFTMSSCWICSAARRPSTDRRTLDKAGVMRYT